MLTNESPSSNHGESTAPPQPPAENFWQLAGLLGATVLLTLALALLPADLFKRLGNLGYAGVFFLTLFSSASLFLPSPALGAALLASKSLNPWLVGLIAGVAAGLGETTGYLAGYGGSTLASRSRFYPRIEREVRRWGALTIFILAFIPSPLFDLAGIAAGTLRMPFRTYFSACLAGKVGRFLGVAWIGYFFLR